MRATKGARRKPRREDLWVLWFVRHLMECTDEEVARGLEPRSLSFRRALALIEDLAAKGVSVGDVHRVAVYSDPHLERLRNELARPALLKRLQRLHKRYPRRNDLFLLLRETIVRRGRPRRGDEAKTLKSLRPWEKLGISRPTWYRRNRVL